MKTVLITGIGKGLGKAFFNEFVSKGYCVYGLLRNEQDYNELLEQQLPNVKLILADVSREECIEKIKQILLDDALDLVINNAGIGGEGMALEETHAGEILELLNVHCLGVLRVMKATKENLLKGDHPTVVNVNSRFGSVSHQYNKTFQHLDVSYSYRIAKAAQNMLTNCLRVEFGNSIEFVSVTPGKLITELAQVDANLSPAEGAHRIVTFWEEGRLKAQNGILQVPDHLTDW
jgi:NAD(P)-dependent dehydrogenase (short-subunit alcohol dehydrogenase family)